MLIAMHGGLALIYDRPRRVQQISRHERRAALSQIVVEMVGQLRAELDERAQFFQPVNSGSKQVPSSSDTISCIRTCTS